MALLSIPPSTRVFRLINQLGNPTQWHILKVSKHNGFDQKHNPQRPDLWPTQTHIGYCGRRIDDRYTNPKAPGREGNLEWSTVAEVKTICPTCWPYKVTNEKPG